MRILNYLAALLLSLALLGATTAPTQGVALAQTDERCFAETGYCISGRIREYWEQNGGLAVFGLPLGPQQETVGEDGQARQAQWFERHRLELHPENQPPYDVLLGRIGVDRLVQQGRDWTTFPKPDIEAEADAERCRLFRETGFIVCDAFLEAFRSYGLSFPDTPGISDAESLALFGLPISTPMTETIEGKELLVQWFERARFELHPDNDPPFNVLFGRLGAELRGEGAGGEARTLTQGPWELVSFGPVGEPQPAAPGGRPATISFESDRVSGSTGCNSFSGPYTATADTITFGLLVSTLAACVEEALTNQERAIFTALEGPRPYSIVGDELRIGYDEGRQELRYRAGPAAQLGVVSGTVTYLQRSALPPQAEIQVQLVDVSRADAPATVLATQTIMANGQQVPFAFELTYDPAQIDPRNTYAVQARISVDGQLLFISTSSYPVITRGNPTKVEIVVEPV